MRPTLAVVQQQPIKALVVEIRKHIYDAKNAEASRDKHRLQAGKKLLWLRKRIEAGEEGDVSWWEWFEAADIGRSRRDAERLMALASADDPDAALEEERKAARTSMARTRAADDSDKRLSQQPNQPLKRGYDLVEHALELISGMDKDQLARFDAEYQETYQ